MHIKFIGRGTGSAKAAADYLTADQDHLGQDREGVNVLRGDPHQVAAVADSLDFKHRYTSGVIAFAPEDSPTDEQIERVIDEFEKTAYAGLEPDRYAWSAVLHREEKGCHIHIFSARVELETGNSLNIAPPGWQETYDHLRDWQNWEQGWAKPDDPERARLIQPQHQAYIDAAQLKQGLAIESNPKALITDYLTQRIEQGLIENRTGILSALEEADLTINRQGKDYISVKPDPESKAIRLKGAIYGQDFQRQRLTETPKSQDRERPGYHHDIDPGRAREAFGRLEAARARRASYHQERYKAPERSFEKNPSRVPGPSRKPQEEASKGLGEVVSDRVEPLSRHLRRELGDDAIFFEQSSIKSGSKRSTGIGNSGTTAGPEQNRSKDVGRDFQREQEWSVSGPSEGDDSPNWLDRWRTRSRKAIGKVRDLYDRTRTAIDDRFQQAVAAIRGGTEAATATDRALVTASGTFERANDELDECLRRRSPTVSQGTRRMRENRADELETFKREINLAEYAASEGYALDKQESSRNSAVMRRSDDKIVIATDQDGHGIYFSVRDDRDNGSIIDFVQKRKGLNLGETRKELRSWSKIDTPSHKPITKPLPSDRDRQQVIQSYAKTETSSYHPYLKSRGLSSRTLNDPRFRDMIRKDQRGNTVFPHYDSEGLAGYELKNREFTGFSRGGTKAVWHSANLGQAERIVITESAIDALSHAQLQETGQETAYLSIGGQMSDHQRQIIERVLDRTSGVVELGLDNDKAGNELSHDIESMGPGTQFERRAPEKGKDWNEELQINKEQSHSLSR